MSILGLDQVLNLVHQYGAGGAESAEASQCRRGRGQAEEDQQQNGQGRPARPAREYRGLRQHNRKQRVRTRKENTRQKIRQRQLAAQSRHFNKTGHARTLDHQLPDRELGRKSAVGKGKWKTWTREAVLRAGFAGETSTCRQVANEMEGASASQARAARFVCASAICKSQAQSCQNIINESQDQPLKFFIRNLMFDESTFELKVGEDAPNSCSVLCSHAQWTMGFPADLADDRATVRDEHVIRPPVVLAPMNSATIWATLSEHPGGIGPCDIAAEHVCTLTTSDAHSANIKMLKHMDAVLPADHLFLPTLCTQHRNGNVIEQLTHLLGNLSGCFCVSRVLNYRHTVQQLRRRTGAALEQDLVVLDSEPAGIQAEWAEAQSLTRSFLRLVAMFDASSKDSADSDEALPVAVELSDGHAQLLDFFNGPWSGLFFLAGGL